MKTDDLISILANGAGPVKHRAALRRLGMALLLGLLVSVALLLLAVGIRRDLVRAMFWPMFWIKILFPASIAVAGFVLVHRLARPGVRVRLAWLGLAAPVVAVWILAAAAWMLAPGQDRPALLWGQSWVACSLTIGLISLPTFISSLAALKDLAPTRPAWAGAAAGVMAGGVGAAVYALHCDETSAVFVAVWYVAGMLLPACAGALIAPRLLRW